MSEVGRLWVSITARTEEFQKGLQNVQQKMGNVGRGMQAAGGAMTKYITLPMVAAAGAMFGGAVKAGQFADELLDLSAVTGVGTDQLQRWRYMAVAAGTDSDAVADALSRMNRRMVDGTEFGARLERTAEGYGVALRDANDNVRDSTDVITDLMMAIAAIEDPQERARAGAQAFGRDWDAIAPVVELGTGAIKEWNEQDVIDRKKLEDMNAFREQWDLMKNSLSLAFMEIVGEYIPILTELIEKLKDELGPIVENIKEKVEEWITKWQEMSPETQKLIGFILLLVAAAGPLLTVMGSILVVMSLISGAAIILFAKIILIIAIIALVVLAIKKLWDENEAFREAVIAIWEGIKEAALAIWGALQAFWEEHGEMIMETLGAVWEFIQAAWEAVWDVISTVAMAIFGALQKFWETWGETIKAAFAIIWDQIKNIFETVMKIIQGIMKLFTSILEGDWEGAWEAIKSIGVTIWNFIKRTAENIFKLLQTALSAIWENIKTKAISIWENIKQGVIDKANAIRESVITTIDAAVQYIKDLPGQAVEWGRNIIQGLIDGIKSNASAVMEVIRGLAGGLVGTILDKLDIGSPSKVFMGIGKNVADGLAIGMESASGMVSAASASMAGASIGGVSGGDTKHVSINMAGLFSGANVRIGSEQDAQALARELYKLTASSARVQGVMI